MEIEKRNNCLRVRSNVHFDENFCFCGRPYIHLVSFDDSVFGCWENTVGIAVRDDDDFDIGVVYITNNETIHKVVHELINWMRDHEQGVSEFHKLWKDRFELIPDCGCERVRW